MMVERRRNMVSQTAWINYDDNDKDVDNDDDDDDDNKHGVSGKVIWTKILK